MLLPDSQRMKLTRHSALVVVGLWWVYPVIPFPASAGEASQPSGTTKELTPEQAAGGPDQLKLMRKFCEPDAKRFCKSVLPGGGRILRCLREYESELAADCRKVVGQNSTGR